MSDFDYFSSSSLFGSVLFFYNVQCNQFIHAMIKRVFYIAAAAHVHDWPPTTYITITASLQAPGGHVAAYLVLFVCFEREQNCIVEAKMYLNDKI